MDDYEFWLSKPNEAETEKAEVEKVVVAEKEEKPKKQKTPKKVKGEKKKKKKEKEEEQPPPAISDEQKIEEPEEVEVRVPVLVHFYTSLPNTRSFPRTCLWRVTKTSIWLAKKSDFRYILRIF